MPDSDFRSAEAKQEADLAAERDEAVTEADAGPIDDDAMAAADGLTASPETARHYQEMTERGAHQQGEGRLP